MTQDPHDQLPENPPSGPGLAVQRRLALAWLSLAWERIWSRLWIIAAYLGLFGILLITDVLPSLHWAVHAGVVLVIAGAIGYAAWRRLRGFAWPIPRRSPRPVRDHLARRPPPADHR